MKRDVVTAFLLSLILALAIVSVIAAVWGKQIVAGSGLAIQ